MTPREDNVRALRSRPYYDSLDEAKAYAKRLIPGMSLGYIPKRERNIDNWIDDKEYLDPKLGSLHWCDNKPPKTKSAMATTRMYVTMKSHLIKVRGGQQLIAYSMFLYS
jgi:hypothetical protein